MRCDACGSGDSLFVVVSRDSQGETRLCRVCAIKKGYLSDEGVTAMPQLDSILDQLETTDKPTETEIYCPECRMGLTQLVEAGRLGCPSCVQVFRRQFLLARKRRGLATGYAGKIPRSFGAGAATADLGQGILPSSGAFVGSRLLADMESAVLAEDFEKAALLRDRLGSIRINGNADHDT